MKSKEARSLIREAEITYEGYKGLQYRDNHIILKSVALKAIKIAEREVENNVRAELLRWRDPEKEFPPEGEEVVCKVRQDGIIKYDIGRHDECGWWQRVRMPGMSPGWCAAYDEILGWRPIDEN